MFDFSVKDIVKTLTGSQGGVDWKIEVVLADDGMYYSFATYGSEVRVSKEYETESLAKDAGCSVLAKMLDDAGVEYA